MSLVVPSATASRRPLGEIAGTHLAGPGLEVVVERRNQAGPCDLNPLKLGNWPPGRSTKDPVVAMVNDTAGITCLPELADAVRRRN